jgi:TonB family protein
MNGRALLQFDTDGAGLVASVRVLEASSGRAEWNEVASEIAAVARNKPMKVPAGARGVAVTLEVTSALKAFDGATPTSNPLTKAVGVLTDPIDAVANTVEALGGGKNPPQRVVAAHVVNVQAF